MLRTRATFGKLGEMLIFTTARTRVRRLEERDLVAMAEVYGDEDAMRYVGDGTALPAEDCQKWFTKTLQNYELHDGLGMWSIEDPSGTKILGFVGIVFPNGFPEVKYALARECWGQGLASEIVKGVVLFAQERTMPELFATVHPDHVASQRVLTKAHFELREVRLDEEDTPAQMWYRKLLTSADDLS